MKNLSLDIEIDTSMNFKTDAYTDKGIKKDINQDALIVKQARTEKNGRVCFACLCDGMGGLSLGEVASATFINRMEKWFNEELPSIFCSDNITIQLNATNNEIDYFRQIEIQWKQIVQQTNNKLKRYGKERGIKLATTAVAILIMSGKYIVMNVGDSRAYIVKNDSLIQITHDQSYVQREIDMGRMTKAQAEVSDRKSVLLQCIGASEHVIPDFRYGNTNDNSFLLCSDGLWRKLKEAEIIYNINCDDGLKKMAGIVKERGEADNISGLIIRV